MNKSGNKVLLIAPVFFDYYKDITKELEQMNYDVTYICDAPSNSNISKAIGRINKNLLVPSVKRYFKNDIKPILDNYQFDYVLLVAGMTFALTPEMMEEIRNYNKTAKFVMYQWDSEKNLPYSTHIHKYFNGVFSFDRFDCLNNNMYHFLPLFYTKTYENIGKYVNNNYEFDCSYIGTAHPKKYKNVNEMATALKYVLPKQYIYHYLPSKLKYYYHKFLSPEYKKTKISDFKWEKVSKGEMENIIKNSKIILDSPQDGQTGLTIRTIECLGAKRKLITTNEDIQNYNFYKKENILIYNEKIDESSNFFASDYVNLPQEIYEKYSLRNWLKTLLEE